MSDDAKKRDKDAAKDTPQGDHDFGDRKSPVDSRFKLGNTFGSKGRKKGARGRKVLIKELFLEKISVREGNTVKTMPKLEAMITQTINDALKGDHKARLASLGMAREAGLLTPEVEEAIEESLSDRDKAIMDDFKRRSGAGVSNPPIETSVSPDRVPPVAPEPNATQPSTPPTTPTPPRYKLTKPVT